jgi:hypothetical protein
MYSTMCCLCLRPDGCWASPTRRAQHRHSPHVAIQHDRHAAFDFVYLVISEPPHPQVWLHEEKGL